jgi:hypothetical protein
MRFFFILGILITVCNSEGMLDGANESLSTAQNQELVKQILQPLDVMPFEEAVDCIISTLREDKKESFISFRDLFKAFEEKIFPTGSEDSDKDSKDADKERKIEAIMASINKYNTKYDTKNIMPYDQILRYREPYQHVEKIKSLIEAMMDLAKKNRDTEIFLNNKSREGSTSNERLLQNKILHLQAKCLMLQMRIMLYRSLRQAKTLEDFDSIMTTDLESQFKSKEEVFKLLEGEISQEDMRNILIFIRSDYDKTLVDHLSEDTNLINFLSQLEEKIKKSKSYQVSQVDMIEKAFDDILNFPNRHLKKHQLTQDELTNLDESLKNYEEKINELTQLEERLVKLKG